MENFYRTILENELKVKELHAKLEQLKELHGVKKLSKDQASIITEVSIHLYFMMDQFPMTVLEELSTEELQRVHLLQDKISSMQTRIMELVRDLDLGTSQ